MRRVVGGSFRGDCRSCSTVASRSLTAAHFPRSQIARPWRGVQGTRRRHRMSLTPTDRKSRSIHGKTLHVDRIADSIARALHREFDSTYAAVKTVVALTGANERAVRNWFDGTNGPSGEFLIALCRHSDEVLET